MSRVSTSKRNYLQNLCKRSEVSQQVLYGHSVVNAISREEKTLDKKIHHLDSMKQNSLQHIESEIELFKLEHQDEGPSTRPNSKMSIISEAGSHIEQNQAFSSNANGLRLPFIDKTKHRKVTKTEMLQRSTGALSLTGLSRTRSLKETKDSAKIKEHKPLRRSISMTERPKDLQEKHVGGTRARIEGQVGSNRKLGDLLWMRKKAGIQSKYNNNTDDFSSELAQNSPLTIPRNPQHMRKPAEGFPTNIEANPECDSGRTRVDSPRYRRRHPNPNHRQPTKISIPTPPPVSERFIHHHSNVNPMLFHPSFNVVGDALCESVEDTDDDANSFAILRNCRYLRIPRYKPSPIGIESVFD